MVITVLDHSFNISTIISVFLVYENGFQLLSRHLFDIGGKRLRINPEFMPQLIPGLRGGDRRKVIAVFIPDLQSASFENVENSGDIIIDMVGECGDRIQ